MKVKQLIEQIKEVNHILGIKIISYIIQYPLCSAISMYLRFGLIIKSMRHSRLSLAPRLFHWNKGYGIKTKQNKKTYLTSNSKGEVLLLPLDTFPTVPSFGALWSQEKRLTKQTWTTSAWRSHQLWDLLSFYV